MNTDIVVRSALKLRILYARLMLHSLGALLIASLLVLSIDVFNDYINIPSAIYTSVIISLVGLIIAIKPYIDDLIALGNYVEMLLSNDNINHSFYLRFSSNIKYLSKIIDILNRSWYRKNNALEDVIAENEVLLNTLPDVLIMVDESYMVVNCNQAATKLFPHNIIGLPIADLIPDKTFFNFVRWVMCGRVGKGIEIYLPEVDKHFIARIERFPIYSSRQIAMLLVLTDISISKKTEQTFVDFIANASHEIKTPLASIKGFIEILQTSAKDDPESAQRFLQIMDGQATRLTKLVNNLLSLSRVEQNLNNPPEDEVDIIKVIHTAITENILELERNNIRVNIEGTQGNYKIIGDNSELTQVFINLISNAIKYGRYDSVIEVSIENMLSMPGCGIDAIMIAVKDQGDGIAPEHLLRLTERFYRVDTSRTMVNKVNSTGLGLSIVKQILGRHNGEITFESTLGEGTTVKVFLPIYTSFK